MKKIKTLLTVLLIALVIVVGLIATQTINWGSSNYMIDLGFLKIPRFIDGNDIQPDLLDEEHYELPSVNKIDVRLVNVDVDYEVSSLVDDIQVNYYGNTEDFTITHALNNGVLLIEQTNTNSNVIGWQRIAKLVIKVPAAALSSLHIETTSGDVNVLNAKLSDLFINSTSGDIKLNNGDVSGQVTSVSGDVEIERLKGELQVKTTSGEIEVSGLEVVNQFDIESTSGDVEVTLISNHPALVISAKTTSGEIESDRPLNASGELKLNISTTSGDIEIE